jgi:glyoxylase-like metal-dependent hydrolase (beta-lactamase superfamily II)
VLVVDTHSKPSAARELVAEIKKLTDKPVRYVVNTHFHWDHYQGNQAYPASWPAGVEIISSEATRHSIEKRGIPRVKHEIITMPQEIEQLKTDLVKATDAKQCRTSIKPDSGRGLSRRTKDHAVHATDNDL